MLVLQYDQEMEEREKLVGRMWDMYTRTSDEVRLPRFWQEAFEAAYEELAGDDVQVRDAAISEIARMSAHKLELEQTLNENEVCPKTVSHLNYLQMPYVSSNSLFIVRFPLFCESDTSFPCQLIPLQTKYCYECNPCICIPFSSNGNGPNSDMTPDNISSGLYFHQRCYLVSANGLVEPS